LANQLSVRACWMAGYNSCVCARSGTYEQIFSVQNGNIRPEECNDRPIYRKGGRGG
jgi:hypothetical protein